MPELTFQIEESEAVPFAVAPTIAFKLRITTLATAAVVHSIALRCQIQIESARRIYQSDEKERLFDLFGEPQRWGRTLRSMLWTNVNLNVPGFTHETFVDIPVACTFDFNVASTKYFAALENGEVPLSFLFSGTVFYPDAGGQLQVQQIPWEKEATYRLPITAWRQMMDIYYPNEVWLTLRRDIFDRIHEYKRRRQIPTWDQTFEHLLLLGDQVDESGLSAKRAS